MRAENAGVYLSMYDIRATGQSTRKIQFTVKKTVECLIERSLSVSVSGVYGAFILAQNIKLDV